MNEAELRQKISQEIEQADTLDYEFLGCNCREEFAALIRGGAPRTYELITYMAACKTGGRDHTPVPFPNAGERQRWIDAHPEKWGHRFEGDIYETPAYPPVETPKSSQVTPYPPQEAE